MATSTKTHLVKLSGLTTGKDHVLNGGGLAKLKNLRPEGGGMLLPVSAPSCPTALWALITAACDVSWPFPQLVVTEKVMLLFGNKSGVGKVWKVVYTSGSWSLSILTLYGQYTAATLASLPSHTALWHSADVGKGVVLTDGTNTIVYDSATELVTFYNSALSEPHLKIGAVGEFEGYLYLGGFVQANNWDDYWRDAVVGNTDITSAGLDFGTKTVWRSAAGDYDVEKFLDPGDAATELVTNGTLAVTEHILQPNFTITTADDFLPSGGWSWSWDTYPTPGGFPVSGVQNIAGSENITIDQNIDPSLQNAVVNNSYYTVRVKTLSQTAGTLRVWLDDDSTRGSGRTHLTVTGTGNATTYATLQNKMDTSIGVLEIRSRMPAGVETMFVGIVDSLHVFSLSGWALSSGWILVDDAVDSEIYVLQWASPVAAISQSLTTTARTTYKVTVVLEGTASVTLGDAAAVTFTSVAEGTVTHYITTTDGGSTLTFLGSDDGYLRSISVKAVSYDSLYSIQEGQCWMDLSDSGKLLCYRKLLNCMLAYCENGVYALFNYIETGSFGSRKVCDVGLLDRNLVAGDEYMQRFIDQKGHLRSISSEDIAMYKPATDMGLNLYLGEVEGDTPVFSYEPGESEWWVGYKESGTGLGFLVTKSGAARTSFAASHVYRLFGDRVCMVAAASGTTSFELETEPFDMASEEYTAHTLKRIKRVRIVSTGLSSVSVVVTGSTLGTTPDYGLTSVTSDYIDSVVSVTGHTFVLNITGTINASTGAIYGIEVEWEPAE